ncbi:MAG: SDR family oxidoreductase [Gammaproteobacteria bacterium]|nr:SDR family oxidoreductase [Gammaproteobacteria bacterium]
MRFDDKCILVTGGTSGIGKATAQLLAQRGAHVVITGRREQEGARAVSELAVQGLSCEFLRMDVSREQDVAEAIETLVARYGKLDGAFNNAGVGGELSPLISMTESNWDTVLSTNLKGIWLSMKYEIPAILKAGTGSIVNMSSAWGIGASGMGLSAYIASKHGVIGLTKAAALEYGGQGVRVNAICPAWVPTPANEAVLTNPDARAAISSQHPIGRLGTTEEIAEAVLWLLSDRSSFVLGHTLVADGGYLL